MCDFWSSYYKTVVPHRQAKRFAQGTASNTLRFSLYPVDAVIAQLNSNSLLTVPSSINSDSNTSSSSLPLSPYWCNRGLGVLSTLKNDSIVCFCPPQYYGEKCSFHADRLSVLFNVDLSQSSYSSTNLLKLLILFIGNEEILERNQFHVSFPSLSGGTSKKFISHFVYPRSSLLPVHRYSIRIELYKIRSNEEPLLIGVWKYPSPFVHLPVTRLAKVLRLTSFFNERGNPCSSRPCHSDEECYPLMNDKSRFICLCPTNFTGENCSRRDRQCDRGYCLSGSLCQPDRSRSSSPSCLCPLNRYGRRCSIEHNLCQSKPCLNNGSCFPESHPHQVICLCTKEYSGSRCQWKRPSIHLSLSTDLSYAGAVIQLFEIDTSSLSLILLDQQVFKTLAAHIDYYHPRQTRMTGVAVVKLYSSAEEQSTSDVYLLSLYVDLLSLRGTTKISRINQCEHRRSSPMRFHQICRDEVDLLCFRDDVYLCLCAENHRRVECFLYDDELDRCSNCLFEGRCLKGDIRVKNDFLCLCPECHSGRECQFNTKSFAFTLEQLFSPDLLSNQRRLTISLLLFFSFLLFLLALPNNLFSFVTLLRPRCRRYGVGHYLLWMSVVNQVSLALLIARLLLLIVNTTGTSSSSQTNDLLCKSFNYLLSSFIRLVYWLTSLVSIERLYTTLSLRGQWLKQPRIALRLIILVVIAVFITDLYELFFYKSFSTQIDGQGSFCVLDISAGDRSLWLAFHLLFLILHSFVPFLINLCSTIIIIFVVINKKVKTHPGNHSICQRCHSSNTFSL